MKINLFKKCAFYLIIISMFFLNIKGTYSAKANSREHLEKVGDTYYYYLSSGELMKAEFERYKRINDTYYFVNEEGILHEKSSFYYTVCKNTEFDALIGKSIWYEDVKDFKYAKGSANTQYTVLSKEVMSELPDLHAFYTNDKYDEEYKDIFLIGDSYAFNMALNTNANFRFAVKPGYPLISIKNEILDMVDWGSIKYLIIFVGPNDLMKSSTLDEFSNNLTYISNYTIGRGVYPIFTSYLGIPGSDSKYAVNNSVYDAIVKATTEHLGTTFINLVELDEAKGRTANDDYVHPVPSFYDPAFRKIVNYIKKNVGV